MTGETGDDVGEIGGREDVVVVDEDQEFAAGFDDAAQAGAGEAEAHFGDDASIRVGLENFVGGKGGRGGVVDDEQFPLREGQGLRGETGEGARETTGVRVVRAEDDGELGHRGERGN